MANTKSKSDTETKSSKEPDYSQKNDAQGTGMPAGQPLGGLTVKGAGKANARLFQTAPDVKEWLTEDEAKDKGFYWKPDADRDTKKKS